MKLYSGHEVFKITLKIQLSAGKLKKFSQMVYWQLSLKSIKEQVSWNFLRAFTVK
jgi:hypothetical protein